MVDTGAGTSIFDPVLTELCYRWFSPPDGLLLDPFAGGSVRGIVASRLGRAYTGIELRPEQIAANRQQAQTLCTDPMPRWIEGDSQNIEKLAGDRRYDMIFSCPPYADLEVYSDDPRDLSTMSYEAFRSAYRNIIQGAVALLKPDRFAAFVVGDVRGKDGFYYGFPWHTVEAFEAAGARLYNEVIFVPPVGSLPVRAGRQFERSRKLGKAHQNLFVFCNGDPAKATAAIGPVDFGDDDPAALGEE
jgi:DNA modification methylase